jgi:hypothetical protein
VLFGISWGTDLRTLWEQRGKKIPLPQRKKLHFLPLHAKPSHWLHENFLCRIILWYTLPRAGAPVQLEDGIRTDTKFCTLPILKIVFLAKKNSLLFLAFPYLWKCDNFKGASLSFGWWKWASFVQSLYNLKKNFNR